MDQINHIPEIIWVNYMIIFCICPLITIDLAQNNSWKNVKTDENVSGNKENVRLARAESQPCWYTDISTTIVILHLYNSSTTQVFK